LDFTMHKQNTTQYVLDSTMHKQNTTQYELDHTMHKQTQHNMCCTLLCV
jgi:hypothetical protein